MAEQIVSNSYVSSNPDYLVKVTNLGVGQIQSVTPESVMTTATLSNVAASITAVTLSVANTNRKGLIVYNDSTSTMYLKYGAAASATSFTYKLASQEFYYMKIEDFTFAIVTGIWAVANGAARITELT